MRRIAILIAGAQLLAAPALADGDYVPPVADPLVVKECGACHMPFAPGFLPARSWRQIMGTLSSHFGEDASLGADDAQRIEAYLVERAGDSGRSGARGGKYVQGIGPDASPARITETPWWTRKHERKGRTAPATLARRGIKSTAQCAGCHRDAEKGLYDD